MFEFSPQRLDLRAGARGKQHQRNLPPIHFGQSFLRAGKQMAMRIQEGAFEGCKDQLPGSEQDA